MTADAIPEHVATCPECGSRLFDDGEFVLCESVVNEDRQLAELHTWDGWEHALERVAHWKAR